MSRNHFFGGSCASFVDVWISTALITVGTFEFLAIELLASYYSVANYYTVNNQSIQVLVAQY
jgi:hypothetical protein